MAIKLKELFKKNNKDIDKEKKVPADEIPSVPDGLFTNCGQCHEMILTEDLYAGNMICQNAAIILRLMHIQEYQWLQTITHL